MQSLSLSYSILPPDSSKKEKEREMLGNSSIWRFGIYNMTSIIYAQNRSIWKINYIFQFNQALKLVHSLGIYIVVHKNNTISNIKLEKKIQSHFQTFGITTRRIFFCCYNWFCFCVFLLENLLLLHIFPQSYFNNNLQTNLIIFD